MEAVKERSMVSIHTRNIVCSLVHVTLTAIVSPFSDRSKRTILDSSPIAVDILKNKGGSAELLIWPNSK